MKTLVLGLGNPIRGDDGVGFRIAQELRAKLNQPDITVTESSASGLGLLDLLVSYDKAVIIDAIQTEGGRAGDVYRLEPEAFSATRHATTPHDVNFATALELGRRVGLALPREITIFAVEVENVDSFTEECSPEVERAVPVVAGMVINELAAIM